MLGHFKKIYGGQPEMAVRRVLFCRQHNGKFRTLARLRNHLDIAALPRYDLAGQIQANAHTLLFVYFFLTIEALEDSGLIAFGNALASVGHFDFHIHFPQHHRHSDFPACRGVLHRIVQQVKEGFGCPLAVMGNGQILRAVHRHGDFLFLRCIHDPTHGLRHSIKEAARFLIQLDHACFQTDKLDFLFQALVKTSRLETGVIQLDKKPGRLFDTVAQAMSGIVYAAEKKEIAVSVDCPEDLAVSHDSKWTSEALFNLLDNAVKYTPAGGKIAVSVVLWEMYVEIKVADTGKGISESNQAAIFRRFYREEEVHEQQGVGIGLYLAREIITRQGGYIRVVSEPGRGSEFSIMLPTK